jgi:hypothetical protein
MATVGLLASWGAALFAAWAFVGGMIGITPGHPARRSAERALVASAIAAAVATAALVQLLLAGDVTIAYVARSIATNLPNGYRVAALWNLPSGAVLPTATLAALVGGIATARAHSSLGVAAVGAIVLNASVGTDRGTRPLAGVAAPDGGGRSCRALVRDCGRDGIGGAGGRPPGRPARDGWSVGIGRRR